MLDLHLLDRPADLTGDGLLGFFDCRGEWQPLDPDPEIEPC